MTPEDKTFAIEPYKEPVPTLEEWLKGRGLFVDGQGAIHRMGCSGLVLSELAKAHAAIAEYFRKYPDAEPELRKEWGE